MLELKNITKIYNSGAGAQKALDNVSMSFAGHEFVLHSQAQKDG